MARLFRGWGKAINHAFKKVARVVKSAVRFAIENPIATVAIIAGGALIAPKMAYWLGKASAKAAWWLTKKAAANIVAPGAPFIPGVSSPSRAVTLGVDVAKYLFQ